MTIYTTPLQFGYFFGLLFAVLLFVRAKKNERYSDLLLGIVLFLLSMQLQDYTFGFAGINILWEKYNGFPRHFSLAFAPTIYLYFKSQTTQNFELKKGDLKYFVIYFVYFFANLAIFMQGEKFVKAYQISQVGYWVQGTENTLVFFSYLYFTYKTLELFKKYRHWVEHQFSNTEAITFNWLRNFLYLILIEETLKFSWFFADAYLNLPYEKDFWWQLFTVGSVVYIGINGYMQTPPKLTNLFDATPENKPIVPDKDLFAWKTTLETCMATQMPYLNPELTLSDLAKQLKTNTSIVSAVINHVFDKNFNDFVNEYRINEFKNQVNNPKNKHLSLLGVALDCGFNSKSTFNRACKKLTGKLPSQWQSQ